jgi:hypothetical protein
MKTIEITITSGTYDCECCGFYSQSEAVATLDGEPIMGIFYDGHMGYGVWDGEEDSLLELLIGNLYGTPYIHIDSTDYTNVKGDTESETNGPKITFFQRDDIFSIHVDSGREVLITGYQLSREEVELWADYDQEVYNTFLLRSLRAMGYEIVFIYLRDPSSDI